MNQWLKPRKGSTGSNLVDQGRVQCAISCVGKGVDSVAEFCRRRGGRAESLRRRRGEAAGVELGTALTDRSNMNVGTVPGRPTRREAIAAAGRLAVSRRPVDGTEVS